MLHCQPYVIMFTCRDTNEVDHTRSKDSILHVLFVENHISAVTSSRLDCCMHPQGSRRELVRRSDVADPRASQPWPCRQRRLDLEHVHVDSLYISKYYTMFITLDAAAGVPHGRQKSVSDRACDQCKFRKVRCDMGNPCKTCTGRNAKCTFNEARKKRGPVPGRISRLRRDQSKMSAKESILDFRDAVTVANATTAPSSSQDGSTLHQVSTDSPGRLSITDSQPSPSLGYWPSTGDSAQPLTETQHALNGITNVQGSLPQPGAASAMSHDMEVSDFLLPSLPIDSPPDDSFNLFATISDLPPIVESVEFWPKSISQEALLPWIDVYFKRLHPTVPMLNRTMIYQDMLLRTHHHDPQFGAMLLALCAFAMTQPVQIHEVASTPSRSVQARMLLEESVKMRMTVDFGENPSVHMVLASFFIFACLFGNGLHKAAHHRLREAVDLANSLSMHLPQAYDMLDPETREQWLRTYLVLSVTER